MRVVLRTLALLALALAPRASATAIDDVDARFEDAVSAYRAADYATAETLWRSLLSEDLPSEQRAVVLFDLGNAAYRQDELMEAVAWYESCVRTAPRDADAWRNLELARLEAGLEPADRGDLGATTTRLLESLTEGEAGWLVLGALGVWFLFLLGEAVRGGTTWRRLAWLGIPLVLASAAPLTWRLVNRPLDPVMIVERPAASLRAEPRLERSPIGQATAGVVAERIDELGEWVRIELEGGMRGWLPRDSVFALQ